MKTLVGIDRSATYQDALELLGKLNFAENKTVLAHIEPPVIAPLAGSPVLYDVPDDTAGVIAQVGQQLLSEAAQTAERQGLGTEIETLYSVGLNSSAALMQIAEDQKIDLVAIGSGRRGPLESFFLGSVGRALAIHGEQSFLVARGDHHQKPLRAVFATDHSGYADRCFARLLQMNPQGIGHLSIVTATESCIDANAGEGFPISDQEDDFKARGEDLVARWTATGRSADYRLIEGFPADAVRQAMDNADLLILGARGHGFIERILIGSFALHAIVAEQYSVLVLRLP